MTHVVRLLHLEDSPADCELISAALKAGGFQVESRAAGTRGEYLRALEQGGFDIILADCNLPGFDGLEALALARERRPEAPFLFVSGFIGEEAALESLKNGATDYVFKHNLARLAPAVRRALREAREHRERQQAEAALQEREATLASFFNTAPFMMGIVELLPDDLRHLSDNAASARFLGTTPEAMRQRLASELGFPPELIRQWLEQCREAHRLDRPLDAEHQFTRAGQPRWMSVTVSALPAAAGQAPRFCYVAADTTGKKQLEQQFLRAQRLESVGTLASGIAHDLNNVLAPIMMSLRLFRAKLPGAEDQEVLDSMESSARRGADIIRQVLTFARGVEGARQPLCVGRLITDLAKVLRDTFPRSIQIETDWRPDLSQVNGDATQLYQVLMNLCVNARDAMPGGGRLRLRAENISSRPEAARPHPDARAGDSVVITVTDTGNGIAPEILDKIFDPFFTTKETSSGTGLGLSTALTIVKSHGGFITVASPPGQGSEFKVHLPAHGPACAASAPVTPDEVPRGNGELILVVDDEPAIRQASHAALAAHGYRALTAGDGPEALALFARERADVRLVVTDMMMPAMDGAALVRTLREWAPDLKVITMSGSMEGGSGANPPGAGRAIVLQKPFTAERLLQAVHEALR